MAGHHVATVWIWDGSQWLQFPAGGAGYDDDEIREMIADNASAISDNATEIQTNRGYINTNISDIATNASEIAKKLDASTIWTGTQDEYDALTPDSNVLYFITA